MKTRFFFLSMALASVMVSCTDGLSDLLQWDEGVMATLPKYVDVTGTRVSFNNSLSGFTWNNGDCIGVCRSSVLANGTAAFTLLKGGSNVGNFINDSFSLNPKADYYAFYPFEAGTTASAFPIDITGQVQTANNSLAHIGKVNYMWAAFTTDDNRKASFTFSNIGAVIQLHFTAENEDTYKSLTISSSGTGFTTNASYNLKDNTITHNTRSTEFQVTFGENGIHVYNGESVVISAVVLPDDLSQSTLTFTIKNRIGAVVKKMDFAGFAFSSGKLYHFYEDDSKGNPPYYGCPDGNHPHAVDLGLPSGTLWSCMDLGADNPISAGVGFAWGETDYVEKNESNWSNYKFMSDSYENQWGIYKYQVEDNQKDGVWYNENGLFVGDNKKTLDLDDDAARVNWKGAWRVPTKEEADELLNYTAHGWVNKYDGSEQFVEVLYKKKTNGNYSLWEPHILLRGGQLISGSTTYQWSYPLWTSSLQNQTQYAYYFYNRGSWGGSLSSSILNLDSSRYLKRGIRPVQSKPGSQSGDRP